MAFGKSTLFSVVSGFVRPLAGRVSGSTMSTSPAGRSPGARAEARPHLPGAARFPTLTVRENLAMALPNPKGESLWRTFLRRGFLRLESELALRVDLIARCRLEAVAQLPAGRLSGGQKKLLELGRAAIRAPRLLLLDEPFNGVNPVMIERLAGLIRRLNADGATLLVVEHNLQALASLVGRMYVMDRGTILASGSPDRVLADDAVRAAYLGRAGARRSELAGVRGGYSDVDVLCGVSLRVEPRQIVTVAGTNGSGKSTMGKAIMGLLPRWSGSIAFEGHDLRRVAAHRRIGLVSSTCRRPPTCFHR
ncbi:MAG: ATP-binding cassette domain-containing protein [Burkholderiales bacterium]